MSRIKKRKQPPIPTLQEVASAEAKDVLVGTIFCKNDPLQRQWLDLQLRFFKATTASYDHVAILFDENAEGFSSQTETILLNRPGGANSLPHLYGLEYLAEVFRSRRKNYRHFLFIDSDAFPIRTDWLELLTQRMEQHTIALPLRTENLESRLHASILFAKNQAMDRMSFQQGQVGLDLLGVREFDIHLPHFQHALKGEVFTLTRSNRVNVHPVLCGVYYDCFYHQCCGSGRAYNLRSRDYWGHVCNIDIDVSYYTQRLMSDPSAFVSELAGWNPDMYAKV